MVIIKKGKRFNNIDFEFNLKNLRLVFSKFFFIKLIPIIFGNKLLISKLYSVNEYFCHVSFFFTTRLDEEIASLDVTHSERSMKGKTKMGNKDSKIQRATWK